MSEPQILIAGVGNIFLGDDAFGVEVVRELANGPLPESARVVDFGIRGLDLCYALLDGYELVILVDAVPRGGPPGEVYVIETQANVDLPAGDQGPLIETHRLDPARVLQLVSMMGGQVDRLLVVGCEPTPFNEDDDIRPGLSEAAQAAVPVAAGWVRKLVAEWRPKNQEAADEVTYDCR